MQIFSIMKFKILIALLMIVGINTYSQVKKTKVDIAKKVVVYTSANNTSLRLTKTDELTFEKATQPLETMSCLFVNRNKKFQKFLGIGGAITDASAEVFAKLSPSNQEEFLNAYYNTESGIGYSLIRTNINSCDFSSDMYTYIAENDKELKTFDIKHDLNFKIPLIKKALQKNSKINVYASPWSPPAFMKTNNDRLQGGKLLPEFYQPWANYFVKFINEYKKVGIPIWGLTIQNEPMATQRWESCIYTANEERDFLKNYLGPTLKKQKLDNVKITVWDHNRDLITQRAETILEDPEANKYVWGIGFHWYENWSGGLPMFENVGKVNKMFPNKNLLFTEGCVENFKMENIQTWANGERYGKSMINDFNNGCVGWTDWNVLLDENGGPNHVNNFCFAPIHADVKNDKLIYTPSYYFIGHFSKFIKKEARNVSSVLSRSQLIATSFENPNGKIVSVVLNQTAQSIEYYLINDGQTTKINIPAFAIQTLVY